MRTIELPTQIPMVSSILSFIAIHTEVTCSAALACMTKVVMNHTLHAQRAYTHNNWQQDKTDERLRDVVPVSSLLNRSNHYNVISFQFTPHQKKPNTYDSRHRMTSEA